MDEQPFYKGDILRCINCDLVGLSWPKEGQEYVCTGCRLGDDQRYYIGIEGVQDGEVAWYPWRFELAAPRTTVDDPDQYQIHEL